jgi:hypothetical protein
MPSVSHASFLGVYTEICGLSELHFYWANNIALIHETI